MLEKIKKYATWIMAGVIALGAVIIAILTGSLRRATDDRVKAQQEAQTAQAQADGINTMLTDRETTKQDLQNEEKKLADTPDAGLVDRANKLF